MLRQTTILLFAICAFSIYGSENIETNPEDSGQVKKPTENHSYQNTHSVFILALGFGVPTGPQVGVSLSPLRHLYVEGNINGFILAHEGRFLIGTELDLSRFLATRLGFGVVSGASGSFAGSTGDWGGFTSSMGLRGSLSRYLGWLTAFNFSRYYDTYKAKTIYSPGGQVSICIKSN